MLLYPSIQIYQMDIGSLLNITGEKLIMKTVLILAFVFGIVYNSFFTVSLWGFVVSALAALGYVLVEYEAKDE